MILLKKVFFRPSEACYYGQLARAVWNFFPLLALHVNKLFGSPGKTGV
ncbi:hypothetical protein OL229_04810 [Neisseriaceae bacterium JH1-16]|nr:hypothetical protein [Neisseriaceae bacterium JH1-16]